MENKEIIIDGTDVSECKHFKIGTCLADYLLTDMNFSEAKCELCKNCYYKQLKRKEQECEEINLKNERLVVEKYTMNEEILKFKQALDEIERFCKDVCDSCKKFTPNRQSDISCKFCQATQISNIINKVKEK